MFDFYFEIPLVIRLILQGLAVIVVIFPIAGACSMAERKVAAWIQDRPGPNRAIVPWVAWIPFFGKFLQRLGVFHVMADGGKMMFKEDSLPGHVNKFYFVLAPIVAMIPALTTVVAVPFGAYFDAAGKLIPLGLAPFDIGMLAVFAVSSLGVYSAILAGWASNSKYPFFGSGRASGQTIPTALSRTPAGSSLPLGAVRFSLGTWRSCHCVGKVLAMICFFMWVPWTLPRFRYDQVMKIVCQKWLPLSIANLLFYAIAMALIQK